jgi:beta-glucanase (GH16 family)
MVSPIWRIAPGFARKISFPCLFILVSLFAGGGTYASAQSWTLAWSDEFNGSANSAINAQNWQYDTGILSVNNEVEYYCAPGSSTTPCDPNTPNAYIDGSGHLVIQAIRKNSGVDPYSGSWTSARLNSNYLQSFQYGRIESSMTLPLGPGLWPAFWALGTNISTVGWPASGEIDYMENVPSSGGLGPSTISSTMHGGFNSSNCYCGGNGMGKKYAFPSNDPNGPDVTTFHTYGAIWSPNMVQFYVDDPSNIFFVRTTSDLPSGFQWDFNHPFFLLLNLAVGGTGSWPGPPDNTTPSPALMQVDYVRAYTPSTVTAPTMTATSISVAAGQTSASAVTLTSSIGSGRVYFACSTTAPKASCAFSTDDLLDAYTADFSTVGTHTATLSVSTTANTAAHAKAGIAFADITIFVIALLGMILPRSRRGLLPLLTMLCLLLLASCGGSGSSGTSGGGGGGGSSNGTPPGQYTVTLSAYTISNTGSAPDAVLSIPVTVN